MSLKDSLSSPHSPNSSSLTPYLPEHIQDIIYDKFVEIADTSNSLIKHKQTRINRLDSLYTKLFDPTHYRLKSLNMDHPEYDQYTIYLHKDKKKIHENKKNKDSLKLSLPLPPPRSHSLYSDSELVHDSLGTTFSLTHKRLKENTFLLYFVYVVCVDNDLNSTSVHPGQKCQHSGYQCHHSGYKCHHSGQKYLVEYKLTLSDGNQKERQNNDCSSPHHLDLDILLRTQLVGLENRYIVNYAPTLKDGIQDGLWLFFAFAFEFFKLVRNEYKGCMEVEMHEKSSSLSGVEKNEIMTKMLDAISRFESILREEGQSYQSSGKHQKRHHSMSAPRGWDDDVRYILRGMMNPVNKRLDLLADKKLSRSLV